MEYGITLEDGAYIDMDVDKYDFKMERKDIATDIDNFKFAFSFSDYYHKEVEPEGDIGTDYIDKQFDGKVEFAHSLFNTPGVIGIDAGQGRFSKDAGAPLIANNQNKDIAIYLLKNLNSRIKQLPLVLDKGIPSMMAIALPVMMEQQTGGDRKRSTSFDQSKEDL